MSNQIDVDKEYFSNISHRERAIFEGGISMGALFHQFVGTPVSIETVELLEKSIESSFKLQPCITDVNVNIDRQKLEELNNEFDYISLDGNMLNVKIHVEYKKVKAIIQIEYVEELNYPLMYVDDITT
jgi:hypothetical protein